MFKTIRGKVLWMFFLSISLVIVSMIALFYFQEKNQLLDNTIEASMEI